MEIYRVTLGPRCGSLYIVKLGKLKFTHHRPNLDEALTSDNPIKTHPMWFELRYDGIVIPQTGKRKTQQQKEWDALIEYKRMQYVVGELCAYKYERARDMLVDSLQQLEMEF